MMGEFIDKFLDWHEEHEPASSVLFAIITTYLIVSIWP